MKEAPAFVQGRGQRKPCETWSYYPVHAPRPRLLLALQPTLLRGRKRVFLHFCRALVGSSAPPHESQSRDGWAFHGANQGLGSEH